MRGLFSGLILLILLVGMLTLAVKIQPVRAEGGVVIRGDGSIDPPTAPIYTADNITYTLTGNIADFDGIIIDRGNIVFDGANHTIQHTGPRTIGDMVSVGISSVPYVRANVTIKYTTVEGFEYGLWWSSPNYIFLRNNITNNAICIHLESGPGSIIENDLTNNGDGIELLYCSNVWISGNNITNNACGVWFESASSNSIYGNNITDNASGIELFLSSNNQIYGNNAINNDKGICLYLSSDHNNISGNNITANKQEGIKLARLRLGGFPPLDSSPSYNGIFGNNITNNAYGIWLNSSSNNSVSSNNIANNDYGIWFDYASSNSIYGNNITNNNFGIFSTNNKVYHNNFVNNTQQAACDVTQNNMWDDGYPSGGNYWSDYDGTDLFCGPYQNMSGSDGIGDTPYIIGVDNIDNYPLMTQYPARTLFQGIGTIIYKNCADPADCFYFIRTYDNRYLQPMNLPSTFSVDQLKVRFTANLTGDFTLHGMEAIVLNSISLLGDLDGDLKVNFVDAYWLEQAFGSQPSSFGWNPAADLNFDNVVNVADAILLASNYGARLKQFRLELNLVENKTDYDLGEPINITLTITNMTNETASFLLAPSWWDLFVYNDTNNLLYRWSSGKIFPMYVMFVTLEPGMNISEAMTWPQTCNAVVDNFGTPISPVSPGTYYLVGFYSYYYDLRTVPVQIKII
jgi:parallel beta-helix repeat protein